MLCPPFYDRVVPITDTSDEEGAAGKRYAVRFTRAGQLLG